MVTCIFGVGMKVASLDFHQEVLGRHGNSEEALNLVSSFFCFLVTATIKALESHRKSFLCSPYEFNFLLRE